jgi:hypothetical protein
MKDKLIFWFTENRKNIGYTIGALNVLGGLSLIISGKGAHGFIQLFAGSVLIYDAWMMP